VTCGSSSVSWRDSIQARRSGGDVEVFQYVIADDDGRVLYRRDATAYEAFKYRVWADEGGDHRPADGPLNDFTPHPTGVPGEGPTGPAPAEDTTPASPAAAQTAARLR